MKEDTDRMSALKDGENVQAQNSPSGIYYPTQPTTASLKSTKLKRHKHTHKIHTHIYIIVHTHHIYRHSITYFRNAVALDRIAFTPHSHQSVPMALSLVHWLFFTGPLLVITNHCKLGTTPQGDALTQASSYYNVALVKVAQALMLARCF